MANDHDIHTCGCDNCEAKYAQRYFGNKERYEEVKKESKDSALKDFSSKELKAEIKRRGKK